MAGYIGTKAAVVTPGAERKKVFSITTTTTSLTGLAYTPGFVHVFHNGVRLVDGTDYTATNGTSLTLTTAAQNGDEVVVISYATFQTSDTVTASAGGTFLGAVEFNSTDYIKIPVGTTAQRPGSPASGMIRQNSTTGEPEWYDAANGVWSSFVGYQVEYLVVGGGGGGRASYGGGGGGGGYVEGVLTASGSIPVIIGAGGANTGESGSNSSLGTFAAIGGGGGAQYGASPEHIGKSGGSGGGGGSLSASTSSGAGGAGVSGQGFAGGSGFHQYGSDASGGGGGGAGGAGGNATASVGGAAGAGRAWLNGVTYAAGGVGSSSNNSPGTGGGANTGNGGAGGGTPVAGGSGIVIIRYLGAQRGTGGTVTSSGGYTIHTFTSSGTYTA
jgi:hypothetical protein